MLFSWFILCLCTSLRKNHRKIKLIKLFPFLFSAVSNHRTHRISLHFRCSTTHSNPGVHCDEPGIPASKAGLSVPCLFLLLFLSASFISLNRSSNTHLHNSRLMHWPCYGHLHKYQYGFLLWHLHSLLL